MDQEKLENRRGSHKTDHHNHKRVNVLRSRSSLRHESLFPEHYTRHAMMLML